MHYLRQFMIISLIALAGELLGFLISLPIPASIYGIAIMPVMFIPASVGLMDSFPLLRGSLFAYALILVLSTAAVMIVSGVVTQRVIRSEKRKEDHPHA